MLDIDIAKERILKEYIDGPTIYDLVKNDAMKDLYLMQVREMAKVVYEAALVICDDLCFGCSSDRSDRRLKKIDKLPLGYYNVSYQVVTYGRMEVR